MKVQNMNQRKAQAYNHVTLTDEEAITLVALLREQAKQAHTRSGEHYAKGMRNHANEAARIGRMYTVMAEKVMRELYG